MFVPLLCFSSCCQQHNSVVVCLLAEFEFSSHNFFRVYFWYIFLFLVVSWSMIESFHLLNLLLIFIGLSIHRFCCLPFSIVFWCSEGVWVQASRGKNRMKLLKSFVLRNEFSREKLAWYRVGFFIYYVDLGFGDFTLLRLITNSVFLGIFIIHPLLRHNTQLKNSSEIFQLNLSVFLCLFNNAGIYRYFASCLHAASIIIYIVFIHFDFISTLLSNVSYARGARKNTQANFPCNFRSN